MQNKINVIKSIGRERDLSRQREPELEIPRENLNIHRSEMPQITSNKLPDFLKSLESQGISHQYLRIPPIHLKATQSNFHLDKVHSIIKNKPALPPSIVSRDNYILDGHHRWLADYNTDKHSPSPVLKINLPILDLLAHARRFQGVEFRKG